MATPCYKDNRFIGNAAQMASVASLCFDCPVVQLCGEAGLGEKEGVWGGMLPSDPIRRDHRRTNDTNTRCRNGHPRDIYGTEIDAASQKPIQGCSWCAKLMLEIALGSA